MNYIDYLKTDYWMDVRERVKKRAGYKCQLCNSSDNLQAHHRTYEHQGDELNHLDDLTCLCGTCHSYFHALSQVSRGEKAAASKEREKFRESRGPVRSVELVQITQRNYKKVQYHRWSIKPLEENGIDYRVSGWKKLCIGKLLPIECITKLKDLL